MSFVPQVTYEDFGSTSNLGQSVNDAVTISNTMGFSTIGMRITPPTGGTVVFEGTFDGTNWVAITLRSVNGDLSSQSTTVTDDFLGSVSVMRQIRVRTSVAGSVNGTVMGRVGRDAAVLEGIEFGPPPHKIGYTVFHADKSYTSAQTGVVLYSPSSGKKFVVEDLIVTATGTTDAVITIFDETNSSGNIVYKATADVSVNSLFQFGHGFKRPYESSSAGNELKLTTSAAIDVDIIVHGYEV